MPSAAPRPCTHAGCGVLVRDGSGRCPAHPKPQWQHKPDATPRMRGRKLQAARAALFARQPLCQLCQAAGRVTLAEVRDHIIPLAEGGPDEDNNTQALCKACNDAKGQQEAQRGRLHAPPRR